MPLPYIDRPCHLTSPVHTCCALSCVRSRMLRGAECHGINGRSRLRRLPPVPILSQVTGLLPLRSTLVRQVAPLRSERLCLQTGAVCFRKELFRLAQLDKDDQQKVALPGMPRTCNGYASRQLLCLPNVVNIALP